MTDLETRATHWLVYDIAHRFSSIPEEASTGGGDSRVGVDMLNSKHATPPEELEGMPNPEDYEWDDETFYGVNAKEGTNSFGEVHYHGVRTPPRGNQGFPYRFAVYALGDTLGLPKGATREQVLNATKGKVLAKAQTIAVARLAEKKKKSWQRGSRGAEVDPPSGDL
eukprot:RCo018664